MPADAEPQAPVSPPPPGPAPTASPSPRAEIADLADDLEFVAAPSPRPTASATKARAARRRLIMAGAIVAALVAALGAVVVLREQIAGMVPGSAQLFSAVGLPVNTLGLVVEGVTYKAVLDAGRPVLAVTGAIRNIQKDAVEAPSVRMTLKDRDGEAVANYLVQTLSAKVPAGGVRYFAISLPDPPANAHALEIGFDLGAKTAVTPSPEGAHSTEPPEAKPLPHGSPDALEAHVPH